MIAIREHQNRGYANHGWLETYHSFSFADYHDPNEMGYSVLRVINEDRIAPGKGFPTHPHRDMEIITYILAGALEHRDSMNNGSVIRRGEVQRMSAGTGIQHSEFNHSEHEPVHLLQIWILPRFRGIQPGYEQKEFPDSEKRGKLRIIASPDGRESSVTINQDVVLLATILENGESVEHFIQPGRKVYVHVALGTVRINNVLLDAGDGARISDETKLTLEAPEAAEILLFDMP